MKRLKDLAKGEILRVGDGTYEGLGGGRWRHTPDNYEPKPYKKLTKARQRRMETLVLEQIYHNVHGGPEPIHDLDWIFGD